VLISESPVGNYRRRKTPGLCLVEALPGEVVALGISMCDTTRDGSRIVDNQEIIRFLPDCSSSIPNLTCAKTSEVQLTSCLKSPATRARFQTR